MVRDGERERALDNMILERLDENEAGTGDTCQREHSLERGDEDKEKCGEAASEKYL